MIRDYTDKDKLKVIELLRQNTPEYFDPSEESALEHYLNHEIEDYFVFEHHSEVLGAGGINYFPKEKIAKISWDIISPTSQGKDIGTKLTEYRIHHLRNNPKIESIIVRTSQLAYRFYEKMGFELEHIEKDFWAKDFDLYQMKMKNKLY